MQNTKEHVLHIRYRVNDIIDKSTRVHKRDTTIAPTVIN